ncbi:MAG: GerMN domain-containing protein [Spirochaetales bacterium]|uniref:GerMN domain-containing protein n=1 Tax=Candidatus Thalassospirochaeta sargassi TaxID=3119039 RepID=A0AAJ1I9M1_9SPIO|nr:GerMN domain-containing protein [Spirochaetales bacterium]
MARGKKNNKTSIGCLFWIALILLVLVIFLFNRETIQNVLDETGFVDIVAREREERKPEVEQREAPEASEDNSGVTEVEIIESPPEDTSETEIETSPPEETVIALEVDPETTEPKETEPETVKPAQKVRRSRLYFIEIQDDGNISLKDIIRPVYYVDSPLTETVNTLLEGLSGSELNMGLISLIPEQTELLSISIKGGTAYLNFSDGFRFNAFGVEGYNAQLKQVVYTATEFSSVKNVQILIEGSLNEYMGPEGVYIGEPLSRADF